MASGRIGSGAAVRAAVVAVLLPSILSGCGGDEQARPQTTAEVEGITGDEQYFGDDKFVGRRVTVTAPVSEIVSPTSFVVDSADRGDESLLVVSANLVQDLRQGDVVQVTGTVRQFVYGDYRSEFDLGEPAGYREYENEEFLVATGVEKMSGSVAPTT